VSLKLELRLASLKMEHCTLNIEYSRRKEKCSIFRFNIQYSILNRSNKIKLQPPQAFS
jgi:hypothetical protein